MGSNLGQSYIPFVLNTLLQTYGLLGTYLILSGFVLNAIPFAALIRPTSYYDRTSNKHDENNTYSLFDSFKGVLKIMCMAITKYAPTKSKANDDNPRRHLLNNKTNDGEAAEDGQYIKPQNKQPIEICSTNKMVIATVTNKLVLIIAIANAIDLSGIGNMLAFLPSYAIECGLSTSDAGILLSIISFNQIFSRPLYGYIADTSGLKRHHLIIFCELFAGTATILMPLIRTYPLFISYSVFSGIFGAKFSASILPIFAEELEKEALPIAIGVQLMMEGIFAAFSGPTLGKIISSEHHFKTLLTTL